MDLDLAGRRALVTGSSSGIGEGIARMLASEGCAVVVHGRNRERAEKVAREIDAAGVALGELSNDESAAQVHEQARAALGGNIEILVNNAGGSTTDSTARPPLDITLAEWEANYQGNTLAAVRMILHAVPAMVEAGFGRVIQISSAVALQPNNLGPDYSGAKASLNNFTVSLAGSLHGAGVTVNTVTPGVIMMDGLIRWAREQYGNPAMTVEEITARMAGDRIFEVPPAGRLGTPEDIAMVVCMLASPRSGFVTGSNYRVDGGQVRAVL
ncbi:SDR family NAD(P)-dependent oxidoreductase [Novosphingobium album (ex Liu et al. 2023)]|uniref:SDR family oxidoreductase n=1 Tax=Novosphingobium album (ex Liu et al. 2023) TaxID=3031130 RepID=A0ABT5WRN0_9SPHN|nr:SDR family oxidoreductase [Novosphingobium album (ex Liu et al. 2023)]MDE8652683.1 SDR family oxidoreductase [Novosphingobium album (ex Liu et al. 2023)]